MHRLSLRIALPAILLSIMMLGSSTAPGIAAEHFMQIEQVIGGVEGDITAQAIQLRMRFNGQNVLGITRLVVHDSTGSNPIMISDLDRTYPMSTAGSRILITTVPFNSLTDIAVVPDDTITTPIPASYLTAGSLTFQNDAGTLIYWRLSWGGASYTGSCAGSIANNDPDLNFCPAFPTPLPSSDLNALRFTGPAGAASTNNAADYALTTSPSSWVNNAGTMFVLESALTGVDPNLEDFDASPLLIQAPFAPNPFTASTRMAFRLQRDGVARLLISDATGRQVARMENRFGAGSHEFSWNGRDVGGTPVSAGRYFYRLDAAGASRSGNLVLVR